MTNPETWRDVVGYEGLYQVSNLGRVKRVAGTTTRVQRGLTVIQPITERILSPSVAKCGGYHTVRLCKDGVPVTAYVHRLVAVGFIGPSEAGLQVCHRDGNPTNNSHANLRYDTPTGNGADRKMHGTDAIGSKNPMAVIDEEGAAWIKKRLREEYSVSEVAQMTGMSRQLVSGIKAGRLWKHVDYDDYDV